MTGFTPGRAHRESAQLGPARLSSAWRGQTRLVSARHGHGRRAGAGAAAFKVHAQHTHGILAISRRYGDGIETRKETPEAM